MRTAPIILLVAMSTGSCFGIAGSEVPSSDVSQAAIGRVKPALEEALQLRGLRYGSPIFLRIFKEPRELEVLIESNGMFEHFRTYEVCSISGHLGPKLRRGDGQGPEGFYFVTPGRMNPESQFHLSFDIGYPNAYDRYHGRTGSALMVHGDCVSIGCYAMTDAGIEEIYALADAALRGGQPFFRVHVFPFRMTPCNIEGHRGSRWDAFWRNLQEGYEFFEREGRPPNVRVVAGKYVFEAS